MSKMQTALIRLAGRHGFAASSVDDDAIAVEIPCCGRGDEWTAIIVCHDREELLIAIGY